MIRNATVFLSCLLAMGIEGLAVDLTPRYIDTFVDGFASRRLYFADGEKKIGLSLDQETKVEGGSGGAVFRFTKVPDATLRCRQKERNYSRVSFRTWGPMTRYSAREVPQCVGSALQLFPPSVRTASRLEVRERKLRSRL